MNGEFVFEKLTLIEIDAPIWSGEKAIPKAELQLSLRDYTDKSLEQLPAVKPGKIQLIDSEKLAPFTRFRTRAQTILTSHGIRYMSAVGVPNEMHKQAIAEIKEAQSEFETYKRTFLYNYDKWVDEFANANPDIKQLILRHKKDIKVIERSLGFEYNVFKIAATEDSDEARNQLDKTTKGLGDTLFIEISAIAKKAMKDVSREKRKHFSPKIHGTFNIMLKKMRGLSFLDGSILPLCQAVESCLDTLPKEGRIADNAFITAMGVLTTLSDPQLMRMVGEGKEFIKGQSQPGLLSMVNAKKAKAVSAQPKDRVTALDDTEDKSKTVVSDVDTPTKSQARRPIPNLSRKSPMAAFKL